MYAQPLSPVEVELFKLALEKRQQAFQAAQVEMQQRMKPVADAHNVPDGVSFDITADDAQPGVLVLKYATPEDGVGSEQIERQIRSVDAGEGAEA